MSDAEGGAWRQQRWVPHTDSTMRLAAAAAAAGAPEGYTVAAGSQSAGRGRRGRTWVSPPGAGLYATTVLRPATAEPWAQLALVAGYAAWRALRLLGADAVRLKWPNDVVLGDGRKLAGVLLEADGGCVLVGIGINLMPRRDARLATAAPLPPRYVGLRELLPRLPAAEAGRAAVLHAYVRALRHHYGAWRAHGLEPLCRAWDAADALRQAAVRAEGPSGPLRGRADGLAADGRLRLLTAAGLQLVQAGEVQRLRRAGPEGARVRQRDAAEPIFSPCG